MTNCKHYFGRTVKSVEGIPYGYEYGCLAGKDFDHCGKECDGYEPLGVLGDIKRAVDALNDNGSEVRKVVMPKGEYDNLSPEQIEWAERRFNVTIVPVEHKVSYEREQCSPVMHRMKPKSFARNRKSRRRMQNKSKMNNRWKRK